DIYIYLPSSRRPIRSSDAARCAPLGNSDFTWEDAALGPPGLPQQFDIKYVGDQKIIALVHALPSALKLCGSSSQLPADIILQRAKAYCPGQNRVWASGNSETFM